MESHDILEQSREFKAYEVRNMILSPDQWNTYPNRINLTWNKVIFNSGEVNNVPDNESGVYSFVVIPGIANHIECSYLLYVGETKRSFRERYRDYLDIQREGKKRVHIFEMVTNWKTHLWFCYAPINQADMIEDVENDLLAAYLPPYNRDFPATVRHSIRVLR